MHSFMWLSQLKKNWGSLVFRLKEKFRREELGSSDVDVSVTVESQPAEGNIDQSKIGALSTEQKATIQYAL